MPDLLFELGAIMVVLFLGGLLAIRLGQSVILAYILIGLLLQGVVTHGPLVNALSTVGLLLLFFLGLEFSLQQMKRFWRPMAASGTVDLLVNLPIGILLGRLLGWDWLGACYLGGILYISSSAVVTKALIDTRQAANPESDTIVGILVFEDLVIVLYLALLASMTTAGEWGSGGVEALGWALARVVAFGFLFLAIPYVFLPRLNRFLHIEQAELFLLFAFGLVILYAAAAARLGLSEAIGAFVAGLLLSETAHKERLVERLSPFRDLFTAIFFLSFGMTIRIGELAEGWAVVFLILLAALLGKLLSGYLAGRLRRLSVRASLGIGLSLWPRGEFSIVLAGVAAAGLGGAAGAHILPLTGFLVFSSGILGLIAMKEFPRVWKWWSAERSEAADQEPEKGKG
ncbi:MAG: cation:proton antiporter [Nitrospirae bacterium]|nr:cation:proton antiporter [Nitrospirota bacterium]